MKRFGLSDFGMLSMGLALAATLIAAGCGDGGKGPVDMTGGLPDGFLLTTCSSAEDCSPTKCQTAKCNPVTKMCVYTDKVCTADTACQAGKCDDTTGECVQEAANDNMDCSTDQGSPGTCSSGLCNPIPNCDDPSGSTFALDLECDRASLSIDKNDTTISSFGDSAAVVNGYACAPGEVGPEVSYRLVHQDSVGDEDITVFLKLVDDAGNVLADQTVVDLDLVILEDACTGTAKCMNPAAGSGFQGVTTGTSDERLTFKATAGKDYYAVVDSKSMTATHKYKIEVESCGKCQPTATTRLDCNMSVNISASTATGTSVLTDYKCGSGPTTVAATGKEVPFFFVPTGTATRNVVAKIVGATMPYKLLVMPVTIWGQCDIDHCIDFKEGNSGDNTLTWKTSPGSYGFERFWVVVDTPTATDASFGLDVDCPPYCASSKTLACAGSFETKTVSSTTVGAATQASKWGPGAGCDGFTNLTGPETTVMFVPTILVDTPYQFQLVSNTAGKDLTMTVLDAGTTVGPACDPTAACMTNTALSGGSYTGTRTTNQAGGKAAGIQFTAQKNHTYFIVVDGTDAAGAAFDMKAIGVGAGSGCQ